ncbi:hypothetical protein [Helicobacter sp. T3_23-1056]
MICKFSPNKNFCPATNPAQSKLYPAKNSALDSAQPKTLPATKLPSQNPTALILC